MKKKLCRTVFGLLPKLYCEKKIFVLQPWFCITRERAGKKKIVVKIVLQYNFCIVEKKV